MKQQILELLNTLSEEEQNEIMEEVIKSLKQQRLAKAFELEKEANRLRWNLNKL